MAVLSSFSQSRSSRCGGFFDGSDHAEADVAFVADPVLGIDPSRTPERRNAALSWRQPSTGSEIQRSRPTRSQTTWMFRPVVWCLPEWSSGWLSQLQQLTKVPSTISCSSLGNSSAVGVNGRIIRASAGVIAVIAREIVDWDTS